MDIDRFPLDDLCEAAEPRPDLVVLGEGEVDETLRCSICGIPADEAGSLPGGYANPVCDACDQLAVSESGDDPWHGWKPGERPDSEPGTIRMPPDRGENPVYIAGVKCWRRYRFGGWITRRDAFDCETLEEFQSTHRIDGAWIHAFNTPRPDGVELSEQRCRALLEERDRTADLLERAETFIEGSASESTISEFADRLAGSEVTLPATPEPTDDPEEFAQIARRAIEDHLRSQTLTRLCDRYYRS